ncbi:MAG: hypothetical protein M3308_11045 [Actinomycetota bacterium]|nr:hypothetical protein [Actinomycetota bacterium]
MRGSPGRHSSWGSAGLLQIACGMGDQARLLSGETLDPVLHRGMRTERKQES